MAIALEREQPRQSHYQQAIHSINPLQPGALPDEHDLSENPSQHNDPSAKADHMFPGMPHDDQDGGN